MGSGEQRKQVMQLLSQYLGLVGIPHSVTEPSQSRAIWAAFPDLSVPSRTFALVQKRFGNGRRCKSPIDRCASRLRICGSSPHSLIRAGRRWHLRAFHDQSGFRDYALGRVERRSDSIRRLERTEKDDRAWMTKVPVRLVAHPT